MTLDQAWTEMITAGCLGAMPVIFHQTIGSTNEEALRLARAGAPAGTVVLAESQNRGRGRLGREWMSPPLVGLYCSIILRPQLNPAELPRLTLAAGLAVSRAIEKISGLVTQLKWPNDLWLSRRKVGGILAEAHLSAEAGIVILGIGLNVNTDLSGFPDTLRSRVTSLLAETGQLWARSSLLSSIWEELHAEVGRLEAHGFAAILRDWRERDALLGRELSWVSGNGQAVRGIALGPDQDGLLRIRDGAGKIHEVISGDLSLLDSEKR